MIHITDKYGLDIIIEDEVCEANEFLKITVESHKTLIAISLKREEVVKMAAHLNKVLEGLD